MTLQVYQLEDGKQAMVEIPALDGTIATRFEVQHTGNAIRVQRRGASKVWKVLLVGIDSVNKPESTEIIDSSTLIKVNKDIEELTIELK